MREQVEGHFAGSQKTELYYQVWPVDSPRGTLVITHGLGEHSECYNRLAQGLRPTQWQICAWDLRGHGRSEGQRGYVDNFAEHCDDLNAFVGFLRARPQYRAQPLVLLGHSMGGLITIRTLQKFPDLRPVALCLSSPLLGVAVKVPPLKGMAAGVLSRYLPRLTLFNEIKFDFLSRDAEVLKTYPTDPLRHEKISPRLYTTLMENMALALSEASTLTLPVLLQMAGHDLVVSREASEQFFELLGAKEKRKIVYEDYYHEIFNDLGREKVFKDLKSFLAGYEK